MPRFALRSILSAIGFTAGLLFVIFVITNLNQTPDDFEDRSEKCNCPTENAQLVKSPPIIDPKTEKQPETQKQLENKVKIESTVTTTTTTTLPPLPPCKEVKNDSPVQRAIIIYYPAHQSEYFFPEVRWLYRSWAEMLKSQPPTWRTDFLIFTYNYSAEFRSLGCINRIRQNKEEPSVCRLFLYIPIQFRFPNVTKANFSNAFEEAVRVAKVYNDSIDQLIKIPMVNDPETFDANRSESLYQNLRNYGYIDSINTIYEGFKTFKMYDFVLRTDIDVFIYRHFGSYIPPNCTLLTGGGGYGTDFNRRKLRRIARDMGYAHVGMSGMGSTWYGSAFDGFVVANYTLEGMLWLAQYEFAMPERESKLGTMLWPEWHYGVLLLYGQHLALNHLVGTNKIRVVIATDRLDQSSTNASPDFVKSGVRLNLHCWHTNDRFSKFAFKLGHYNKTELEKYRNVDTVQAYAMQMALESKYSTLEELAALVSLNATKT